MLEAWVNLSNVPTSIFRPLYYTILVSSTKLLLLIDVTHSLLKEHCFWGIQFYSINNISAHNSWLLLHSHHLWLFSLQYSARTSPWMSAIPLIRTGRTEVPTQLPLKQHSWALPSLTPFNINTSNIWNLQFPENQKEGLFLSHKNTKENKISRPPKKQ